MQTPAALSDTLKIPADSLQNLSDSTALADTTATKAAEGDIETTINYNAEDSIFFDLKSQTLRLYGDTHIDYGEITLEADRTDVNYYNRIIKSTYTTDSAGRKVGKPVFSEAEDVYETDNITYNFNTKRAVIKGVITEQDGAFMHGDDVKKNEKNEMFIRHARYTTCNLEHPHFFIESEKLKVIPGNKVVSGPFNLRFRELLTPVWFPFGMFPQPKKRASGIVFPTYGEERRRGFFLRDGGYYFAISDYLDLRITGDIYSKGGSAANLTSNYYVKYKFRGTFNFRYNRNVSDDIENPLNTNDFWVQWNHRPETRGNSSFSASVSAGTQTFNNNNNQVQQNFEQSIRSDFQSNVSYSQRFAGTPFNITLNGRHSQNIQTGATTMSLPEFTYNMNRIYPFENLVKSSRSPLAKLNFSHNFVAKNELTNQLSRGSFPFEVLEEGEQNDSLEFTFANMPQILDRSRIGGRHQIPLNTSISLFNNISLNPNFNYEEVWYPRELQYTYLEDQQVVNVDTVQRFSRAGSWRSGASLNTIIYGTHFFKGDGKVKAIRHVMTPSLSFSYNPDFSDPRYGVFQEVQVDSTGRTAIVSKYQNFIYGSPSGRESRTLGLSLQNNLEIKVTDEEDTTGTGTKKVKIFDNFALNSSYNFAADSFRLGNIGFSTRTSFFNNAISVAVQGTIDPYTYNLVSESVNQRGDRTVVQQRIDRYAWNTGNGVGKLSSISTNISFSLRPKGSRDSGQNNQNANAAMNRPGGPGSMNNPNMTNYDSELGTEEEIAQINNNPDLYVDFNIPWSLNVNYNITRRQTGFQDANITQTLRFSGDLSLTPKTKINVRSGYDLEELEFTQTSIGINRDLHCWSLSFNWTPFGRFQQFGLIIRPKSSLLQDLKLERRKNFNDFFN